jgi:hypothetical protein
MATLQTQSAQFQKSMSEFYEVPCYIYQYLTYCASDNFGPLQSFVFKLRPKLIYKIGPIFVR